MSDMVYPADGFILFLAPWIGLLIHGPLSKKAGYWIIAIALILLIPAFTSWHYPIQYVYRTLCLIIASILFAFYLQSKNRAVLSKFFSSLLISIFLFAVLGFCYVITNFGQSSKVKKTWDTNQYHIVCIEYGNFVHGGMERYELSKYGWLPFLVKYIESGERPVDGCTVHFEESNLWFNTSTNKFN